MSGFPSEADLRTQWKNAVDLLEKHRVYADATAADGGELDVLEKSLDGTFTAPGLQDFATSLRSLISDPVDPGFAQSALVPVLFEFSRIIDVAASPEDQFGAGYDDIAGALRALFDYMANGPITIESRAITYDTTATTGNGVGGAIVGNGAMTRLTVDDRGFNLEACHVETKRFRCRRDQNSGALEQAEVFEQLGQESGPDNLLRMDSATVPTYGSGTGSNGLIVSKHAGVGSGGSQLQNSSFNTFDNDSTETKYAGWTQSYTVMTASGVSQDTGVTYRGSPGTAAADEGSLKLTVSGGSTNAIVMSQTLTDMQVSQLDSDTPYFLRIMWNGNSGTAAGGTVRLRLGDEEISASVVSTGTWFELMIPADTNTWFRNFNEDGFNIDIEWRGGTSGYLLIDDVILAPYDLIDGTYWCLRGNAAAHTPWLLDDTLTFTDTGGLPATGKLQYWWWVAFGAYLPSDGTPTISDPV